MLGFRTYLKRQKLSVDIEVQKYRESKYQEVVELAKRCAIDIATQEHVYHSKVEQNGIEIAKLEALKETLNNDIVTYKMLLCEKDKEILRLTEICNNIAKSKQIIVKK